MGTLAIAASLMLIAATLVTSSPAPPEVRDAIVACNNADYVFVLNVQHKDYISNPSAYQLQLASIVQRARLLTESGMGVGIVTFSKKVEHTVPVTRSLSTVQGALEKLLSQPPRFDGVATGDAMLAAKKLLELCHKHQVEMGLAHRKLLVVVAVSGEKNAGHHQTSTASALLRQVASHVFAVNLAGGVPLKELYRIASDGTRGIFDASDIVEATTKTELYAQVFCPCPLSWSIYDNCTVRGQAQVQRFFYDRTTQLPHNCVRNSTISFEPCDCPPNRVERSDCVNGVIRVSTFVYSRSSNDSDCTESVSVQTEACGRATGCESFVCPPGSVCVNGTNGTISCNCTNANDVFKTTGCESCGDRTPITRAGPCVNGMRTVAVTTFTKINDTYCQIVNSLRSENCSGCPMNNSLQFGPCVRGYQQVITVYYELKDGRCYKNLRTAQKQCRLTSEYQCIGSALSGGQFVTYDGQLIDFPGPCEYLLSERAGQFQVRVRHAISFPSLPYLTQLDAIVIVIGSASYELTNNLIFKVGAVAQPLPYSDTASGVEAFYIDDSLVFAAGELYIQMRGSAATVSVRSSSGGLRGLLGNCNGSPGDDFTNSTGQDVSQEADPSAALGRSFQVTVCTTGDCCPLPAPVPACGTNTSLEAASVSNCGHLNADAMSPFAHCGGAAMQPLLRACISLYCRAKDNAMWQRSLVCGTLEAAAFRCYLQQSNTNRSSYPIFRSPDFCPKSCGHNAEFVNDADFCPRTCARHFFSKQSLGCATPFGYKSRNVNDQAPLPGCQCKSGYVLDGNNCVLPNECECISNLCIDRENRTICETWKAQGYCEKYPLQMRRYCKLTCDQCQAPCQDQISKETCQLIKTQGRCGDSFYRQMCKLTCNPSDCECPPCKTVRGPCDSQNKNRLVITYCYAPDSGGHCQRNQSSSAYEPCDECLTQETRVQTRSCNYCTQEQITRIVRTVRETSGELRCIDVSGNMTTRSAGCECQSTTNRTVCYRNSELYLISTVSSPSSDCTTCNTAVSETRVRNVTCTTVVQRGECDHVVTKRRPVKITRGIVRNCQCDLITEQYEEMCDCPKAHWTPMICHRNLEKVRWFISFSLVNGRCVPVVKPHKQSVPCERRHHIEHRCNGCARLRKETWYDRHDCNCKRRQKETRAGSCCCSKPTTVRGGCNGEQRRIAITNFVLENHECQPIRRDITERCGCPPSKPIHECNGETGRVSVGKLVFKLVDGTCEEVREVRTLETRCKPMRVIRRGSCHLLRPGDTVKHRQVLYELWKRTEGTCGCSLIRRTKLVACGCREPQVRLSKCPSHCPAVSDRCPKHCYRTRAVVEYRLENGRCIPVERDQQDLPCCCRKPRNKPPVCEHGRVLAWRKRHTQLVGHACSVKEYVVRKDVSRHCDLTNIRRERHGDFIVVKRRAVQHCRCVWREERQKCPTRCPQPKNIVRCDSATGEQVIIHQYYRVHSCHCLPMKKIRRVPVDCPEPKVERLDLCKSEEQVIVIRRLNFYADQNCQCSRKVEEQRYPCEGEVCNRQPVVRLICHANQLINVVTLFKRDANGNCEPHEQRHKIHTPPCKGSRKKKSVKKCINGRLVLFMQWLEEKNCRCRTKHVKRVVGSCSVYCKQRNQGQRLSVRQRCDKHSNQLVVYRLMWQFNGESCVRRWVATEKRVEPDCPQPQIRRSPCDHETGKQRLERLEYRMQDCRCHGPKVHVTYKKCSCRGPKVLSRRCDHRHGCIIVKMLVHEWNFKIDACHARLVRKSIPIPCHHRNEMKHGACVHGRMQYLRIYYIRDKRSCKCRRRIEKQMINCHCPVVVHRQKCDHHRTTAVTTIIFRKFDAHKRRCVVVNEKRQHQKCRCPKRRVVKKCVDGKRLVKSISYRMVNGDCEADRSEETFGVACHKDAVIRSTDCNPHTCFKKILTYHWRVNPRNCQCKLHLVQSRSCRCCGCPKHELHRSCVRDNIWQLKTVVFSLKVKTCSKTCRRHVNYHTERVQCPQSRQVHWSRCNKCRSQKLVTEFRSVGCRCQKQLIKTNHFRTCCCQGGVRLRKWCQQSTGLWVSETSRLVLSNYKCVWHKDVNYLPKPVCQLPETPVVYGACDRSTCQQSVTRVLNELNKLTCSCELKNVTDGTRACCCLDTTPVVTYACINNNMKQRTTVTKVFNETTHTCNTETSIANELVTCDGQTRSTDPPCEGQTREILTTRSEVVNCACVNRTINTRVEQCRCAPATNWTAQCDSSSGMIRLTRTLETLVNGACIASVETNSETRNCSSTPTVVVSACNTDTCMETVTTTDRRLDKPTCACVSDTTIISRRCCCPTTVETRSECINNELNTVSTRQSLDSSTLTCLPVSTTTRAGEVPCINETRVVGACDLATKNRTIIVRRQAVINCVCQAAGVSVIQEICACPQESRIQGECDKKTCMRRITVKSFNAVNQSDGSVQCIKVISHHDQRCCCTLLGQKRVHVHVQCDRQTGSHLINKEWKKFIVTTKECRVFHKTLVKEVDCRGKFDGENKLVQHGRCNYETGLRTITVKWYTLDKRNCRCQLHMKRIDKVCSCKHKRGTNREYCDRDTNELVNQRKYYVLEDNRCALKVSSKRNQIACAENRQVKESCNECNSVKIISFNVLSGCKCQRKEIIENRKCCCPEEKFYRKCHEGKIKITSIQFRLSHDKRTCVRTENHRYKPIQCSRKVDVKRGNCNRESCLAHDRAFTFHLSGCRCHKKVRVQKRRCCCPKPKLAVRCQGRDTVIHERVVYHLHGGHCRPRLSRKRSRIHCPGPKQLGKTRCNIRTGQRYVKFRAYTLHKCKCIPKHMRRFELCTCRRPHVVREHCNHGRSQRAVFKITYQHHEGKCRPKKRLLYKEPCHCPTPKHRKICDPLGGKSIVEQSLNFHLTMRHGRRECVNAERSEPHNVNCPRRSVKHGRCYDGHREIYTIYYKVHHCKCVKRKRTRRVGCKSKQHRKVRRKQRCSKGRIITITSMINPETGELREQRQVKRVVCRDQPRVVSLTKCCKRNGKNGGIYRKVAVIRSVLSGCRCKERRSISWRLCRCEGRKKSRRCVHNFIEQNYTEEHHRYHGHCKSKKQRRVREHRCHKRPVAIKKSKCNRHDCKRRVVLMKCWMEQCRCRCKQRVGSEDCCTRPPIMKRYCKDSRLFFISTRFELRKEKILGKDSGSGLEWRQNRVRPLTKRWSKGITCPKPEIRQTCNRKTGVLVKRITVYRIIHCKCLPKMRTVHSRCHCPPPRTNAGRCAHGRRRLTHTSYHLDKGGHCRRRHRVSWKPCGCQKPTQNVRCVDGRIRACTTLFQQHRHCRPENRCHSKKVRCPAPEKKRGHCSQRTKKYKTILIRYTVNRKNCKCDRHVAVHYAYCSCHHLNRKRRTCRGNVWVTVQVRYRLQRGECLPDESVTHNVVHCPQPRTQVVPGSCERRKGLSSSGTQIVRTQTYVPFKCHCKSHILNNRVPCDCSLIPKYATQYSTVCHLDKTLVTTIVSYHLVNGKCTPSRDKKSKVVKCHGTKTHRTPCLKDELGDSFQYILNLRQRPNQCRCQWKVDRKVRVNCGCRPPTSQRSCVGDDFWEKTVVSYTRPNVPSSSCEPRTSISTELVNCTTPQTTILPCDTGTCFAKEVTVKFVPKLCHCHPVQSYRKVRCCCPPSVISPEQCNPLTNQFEQVTSRYSLVNNTCVLQQNTTYRTVTCDTRSGETNTTVCNSTSNRQTVSIRDVAIVNCQCVSTVRSFTQPCSCPANERVETGLCNGTQNFTTDNYYRQQYNSTTRECTEVLYNSVQRPCLCNAVVVNITCLGTVLRRITYVDELVNNTCVRNSYITDMEITCAGNGTSRQTRDDCDPTTGTRAVTRVNYVVENCTCVAQSTRASEICNCFQRNGGNIVTSLCRADNVTVRTLSYYYDGPGGVCLQRNFTTEQRITCEGRKETRQGCNKDSGKEEIRVFQLIPLACKCVWSELPARYEDCECKKSYSKKLCHNDKETIITTYYELVDGQCKKKQYERVEPVVCDAEGQKTGVHYGSCSEFGGTRQVVKYEHRVHQCRCVTKRIRRKCSCRCPNSRTWSACQENKIISFHLTYQLEGCRCVKHLKTRESEAICQKRRVWRTACVRGLDGDGHLTVVRSCGRSVNCRCQLEKIEHQEACLCEPRENQVRDCQGRTLTIVTTRRQVVQGACKRVVVKSETRSVACPLQSVRSVSACNKHGYRLLERTTWKAENCQCEPHVRIEKQRCSKDCDRAPKLVRTSRCNKETCTKRLYYYYKNEKCRSQHFVITSKCCCPPSRHGDKKCNDEVFEAKNLFYKLENGVCEMSSVVYREEIACQRNEQFETATAANGETIVLKVWHALKHCKCQKVTEKSHFEQKECLPPQVKHECISVPEDRLVQTVIRYTKQSIDGSCEKTEEVTERPVNCPLDILHRGPCHKDVSRNAYVRTVKRISFKKIDCRCVPETSVQHEVCHCCQSKITRRCQDREGILLITKHHYEIDSSGSECLERQETESVQIHCDGTWRACGRENNWQDRDEGEWDGHFSKFLEREVRVGCSCRVERIKRHCQSHCPKSNQQLECVDGHKLCRVETNYRKTGHCRCSYRVRRTPVPLNLPEQKLIPHGCHNCQQRIETIYYRVKNCKVKRFTRWHSKRCCCDAKPKTAIQCQAGQMLVTQTRMEQLRDGHCVPEYKNRYKLISCLRIISETPLTACIDGKRIWRRELEKAVECSCKRTSEKITRSCGFEACQPSLTKYGLCIGCASKVTKTEFIFNPTKKRCEAKHFHHIINCCCPSPRTSKRCIGNRLQLITSTYKFHVKSGMCIKKDTSKDITQRICKSCKEAKRTTMGPCMENGFRVVVTIHATLVDCECHKTQSFKFLRCRCDAPAVTESCVRNGTVRYHKTVRQELDDSTCKNIINEIYSEVECPVASSSEGVCDTVSCQRIITDVAYSIVNCTCQRTTTQRLETCCCPPTTNETRSCERATNVMTVTRSYQEFDLQNRACIVRTQSDRVGTICPQNYRSFASACDQFRNHSLYRTVSESITVASGCECVPQTTTRTELCGCDAASDFTVCTPDNRILTYRIEYKPDANNTICLPNRVELNVQDVMCDGTPRSDVPNCTIGTRSPTTGETRITVVTTWQRTGNNCTCATQTRSEQVLCACPENSMPKTVCDYKHHEKLNVTTTYTLLVTGSIRQCIPSKVITRLGRLRCQVPVVQLGNCQYGLMVVKTLVHLIHGCTCIPRHYKHQQRCHRHLKPCINKLPDWLCADLDRRHQICTRNFTDAATDQEQQQLADASSLCDKQCNRCDGCLSIGGHWQFKYADRECLVTDARYPGLSIKKYKGFENCLQKCKNDLSCRSFDFYLPSCQCTLAKVDRVGLHDYLLPRHHVLGAVPSDNQNRAATRCNLYERICNLRVTTRLQEIQLGCPNRQVTGGDSHCRCEPVALALGYYQYCYRTINITYFERSVSGVCLKRTNLVRVHCKPCRDYLPKAKCQAIDSVGDCSISSTARLCPRTCRLCLCDGREFVHRGECNHLTGHRVDKVLRTEWVQGFQICRIDVQRVTKKCPKCPVGTVVLPQPCVHGRREILHKTTVLINGKCEESVKREVAYCNGCYPGVSTCLGPCVLGHRTITSVFAVRRKHGACIEQKTFYRIDCSDCPPSIERTQPCIDGRRLRQVTYFVRPPKSKICYEAGFETEDRCGTLCHDQISQPECLYQKQTAQCVWNLYTRIVCPKSCNRC